MAPAPVTRPVLDLSGPRLRQSLELLIGSCEELGGIEAFARALQLKATVFQDMLGGGKAAALSRADFDELAELMATVRRRVGSLIDRHGFPVVGTAIEELLADAYQPGTADARIARFTSALAEAGHAARRPRFLRDLAAEILHNVHPEHYPLMTRWVWDAKANTGVLREIWHGDDVDRLVIDIPDTHETFIVLREELSQFLADHGVFRDMLWYVDLLQAHIYAGYISAQGASFLRPDFASPAPDPLEHTRRILGLDMRTTRDIVQS